MLANVALTDTFDTWRIRTNQLIIQSGQAYDMANAAYEATNTAVISAANITANILASNVIIQNIVLQTANSLLDVVAANVTNTLSSNDYIISITTDAANAAIANLEIAVYDTTNTAFDRANIVYGVTNSAFNQANAALIAAGRAGSIQISNTPPTPATAGELWWNSVYGRLFLYYNDGSSSQWVEAAPDNSVSAVYDIANAAFNTANSASIGLTNETSSSSTYYVPFTANTSGNVSRMNVNSSALTFIPSTGILSATAFNTLSDASLKDDIKPINNALDIINSLEGVGFNWKKSGKHSFGVLAQDTEKVIPDLVDDINNLKTVNYDGIIAFLIEAIKELNNKLENKE